MKKRIVALAFALTMALGMTACGEKQAETTAAPAGTAGASAGTAGAASPEDPSVTLKCGLTFTLEDYRGEDLQWWADRVKELSNGSVTIELYPSETLVKGTESVSAMVMGTIDMYLVNTSYVEGSVPDLEVMNMPCTAPAKKLTERLKLCYDVMEACHDQIFTAFDNAGVKYIGTIGQGGYVDMVFSKPIHTAEEYTGWKVRTTGGISDDILNALGCTPTFISSSDLYLSLQTGVVDGAMTTPNTILNNKLYELCPYMVVPSVNNSYSPYFVCCSNEAWDQLSENQRQIMADAAKECLARTIEVYPDRQNSDREEVKKNLAEYIELPDEEWAKMQEKMNPVYDAYAAEFGELGKEIYDIKCSVEDAFSN